jgi:putative glutamine amidotransferase
MDTYSEAVIASNGIPFILPVPEDTGIISSFIDRIDGIILSGGGDIHPSMWAADHVSGFLTNVHSKRDRYDFELYRASSLLPVLGICRGHQVIAVCEGADLYQDLSEVPAGTIFHKNLENGDRSIHSVFVEEGTMLSKITGSGEITVNSSHHQIVKDAPKGFTISSRSSDGMIESIETIRNNQPVISVQWHPELLPLMEINPLKLCLTGFVEKAGKLT